jgi:hypothetical protein
VNAWNKGNQPALRAAQKVGRAWRGEESRERVRRIRSGTSLAGEGLSLYIVILPAPGATGPVSFSVIRSPPSLLREERFAVRAEMVS